MGQSNDDQSKKSIAVRNENTPPETPPVIEDDTEELDEAPQLTEEEQQLADMHADIDKGMTAFDLSFKYRLEPTEAIRVSVARHYDCGRGSIQDLARIYNIKVDDVLKIVGIDDMSEVEVIGDLIDAEEAGPGAEMNHGGRYKIPYDLS